MAMQHPPDMASRINVTKRLLADPRLSRDKEASLCVTAGKWLLEQPTLQSRQSGAVFLERALRVMPVPDGDCLLLLARLYTRLCLFDQAFERFATFLEKVDPKNHAVRGEYAALLMNCHRLPESLALFATIPPDLRDPPGTNDYALALLTDQQWLPGWALFEHRLRKPTLELPDVPVWTGKEQPPVEYLAVLDEQGIGDTWQFFRFLLTLTKHRPHLRGIYFCPKRAARGAFHPTYADGRILVVGTEFLATCPRIDAQVRLMSLPHVLQLQQLDSCPPYLRADTGERRARWERTLLSKLRRKRRIGFCLRGSQGHAVEKNMAFAPAIHECFGHFSESADFVCLNRREEWEREVAAIDLFDFVHFPEKLDPTSEPFADTAVLVSAMDLVITVDTATAHLAANLGKRVWLLLGYLADWRWGTPGRETIWYPDMRVFRAPEPNHMELVWPMVRAALAEECVAVV